MNFIKLFLFAFIIIVASLKGENDVLILHFDINKTLIASDRAGGKSIDNVLNQLLASTYRSKWDPLIEKPISYEAYVKEVLLPGSEYDQELKKKRLEYLNCFIQYLSAHNHELYQEAKNIYQLAFKKLESANSIVFPSFYKLLNYLDQNEISYVLILRSFGDEIYEIADEINLNYKILFTHKGAFKKRTFFINNESKGNDLLSIYQLLNSHIAIQDDWEYWKDAKMDSTFGKLFPIQPTHKHNLEIFFDDNINIEESETNIIAPIDVNTGQIISMQRLSALGQIFAVDTLEAILDDDYFIKCINESLFKKTSNFSNKPNYTIKSLKSI